MKLYHNTQNIYDTIIFKSYVIFEKGFTNYKEADYNNDLIIIILMLVVFSIGVIFRRTSKKLKNDL